MLIQTSIGNPKLRANYIANSLISISPINDDIFWEKLENIFHWLFNNLEFTIQILFFPFKQLISQWYTSNLYAAIRLSIILTKKVPLFLSDSPHLIQEISTLGLFSEDPNIVNWTMIGLITDIKLNPIRPTKLRIEFINTFISIIETGKTNQFPSACSLLKYVSSRYTYKFTASYFLIFENGEFHRFMFLPLPFISKWSPELFTDDIIILICQSFFNFSHNGCDLSDDCISFADFLFQFFQYFN
jgi:hypothetical protein